MKSTDYTARLLAECAETILREVLAVGGCDHSVGICCCALIEKAREAYAEASALVDGEITLGPLCEIDRKNVEDEARHDAAMAEWDRRAGC